MNHWFYSDPIGIHLEYKDITDFPEGTAGFIYKITNTQTGKFYVGRKALHHLNSKLLTKKEIEAWDKPGRVPKKTKVIKESDWKTYYGSNKQILQEIKESGAINFTREVLQLCKTKKQLTYYEVYWQMYLRVLHVDSYNDNVSGKFYRKDFE